jgi:PAS domain S-box-containing protein
MEPPPGQPERFDPFNAGAATRTRRALPALGYAVALGSVLAALAISRQFIDIFVQNPFMLFFAAVIVTAWYGGTRPAVLALVLSVLVSNYFLIPPFGTFSLEPANLVRSGGFTLVALLITSIYASLQRSRNAIHQQREWFLTTIASIGDGVIATDAQQQVIFLNPVATDLTGWSPQEAFGKDVQTVFPIINEQTRQPVENPVRRVLREGTIVGLGNHTLLISRDGRERAIADSGAPIRDANGVITGVVLVFRDVTLERQQEDQVRQNEARLRTVLENMPVLLLAVDEGGQVAAWNHTAENLTGYPAGEMFGVPGALDRLFPSAEARDQVLAAEAYAERETELIGQDGQRRIIAWSNTSPDFPVQGWARWVVGVDVTERVQAERRTAALQTITAGLSEAVNPQEVADTIVTKAFPLLGAHLGSVVLTEGNSLRILNQATVTAEVREKFYLVARKSATPITDAIQTQQSVWIENLEEYQARYPELISNIQAQTGSQAVACLPMVVNGQTLGGIGISFPQPRPFDDAEREFIQAFAGLASQAIQRALAFEREQTAVRRVTYLAEVSKVLGSSLEYETTLANIAQLAVPTIADWCRIDLVDETGTARLVTVAHVDPQKAAWVYSLEDRYPPDPASPRGLYQVIRTGQSEYISEITDEMLAAAVPDEERFRMMKELGYRSVMIVPLTVRGRTIGAVTYITTDSGRLFNRDDLTLAEEVAQRGAVAVDNARLFRQARELAAVEERQRLARDLHDAVSQTLFSANIIAQALPRLWGRRPDIVTDRLDELRRLNTGALAEMRTLLLELRSEGIQNIALPELLKQLRDAFQSRKRLDIRLDITFAEKLPVPVHTAFYRIAQEALNNVVKHSAATQVTVALTADEICVTLRIQDNGRGFETTDQGGGFGLNIMRERAQEAGAALAVSSTPGSGTEVVLTWMRNAGR